MSELISGYLANAVEAINEEFGEGYAKANLGLVGSFIAACVALETAKDHCGELAAIADALDGVRSELRSGINIMVEGLDLNEVAEAIDPSNERGRHRYASYQQEDGNANAKPKT